MNASHIHKIFTSLPSKHTWTFPEQRGWCLKWEHKYVGKFIKLIFAIEFNISVMKVTLPC